LPVGLQAENYSNFLIQAASDLCVTAFAAFLFAYVADLFKFIASVIPA